MKVIERVKKKVNEKAKTITTNAVINVREFHNQVNVCYNNTPLCYR